ncbi:MAG: sulfatase-like hydrolase/transferase, partial [Planctomycetota bacterium]
MSTGSGFPLLLALIMAQLTMPSVLVAQSSREAESWLHLFILAGQSNMVGVDADRSFTPAVAQELGREHVLVVKDAESGAPISRWDREWHLEGVKPPENRGALYDRLMKRVFSATEGRNVASVTLVWMQGERDARLEYGGVYEASLQRLVDQLSTSLGRTDINVVLGRLSDFDLEDRRYPHWTKVREAQIDFAQASSRRCWVDTDDLNDGLNRAGDSIENDLHYSLDGYQTLGRRFARRAIELVRAHRPNIVLIMSDDHGWGDVSYNGHPFVKTPHLAELAKEGVVFDRFYAAAPVCSPTRASVLTGRSPIRTHVTNHGRYLRPQEQTLAESLRTLGYTTGLFGKLHLGSGQPNSPCNPTAMGFDEWAVGLNFFDNDPYLSRNGTVEPRKGSGSALAVDDATNFLRTHKGNGRP